MAQETEFLKFIKLLDNNGCLSHVILVGSWAEFLYNKANLLPKFVSNLRTLDVDFMVKNIHKPKEKIDIVKLARDDGFLVEKDRLFGTTKIINPEGLEIEFIIAKRGAGSEASVKTNLGVTAQSLRHLDILSKYTKTVEFFNMDIEVPLPEAFVIHKIIINNERKDKKEKDKISINSIYQHIDKTKFNEIYETLTLKEQKIVTEYVEKNVEID